MPLSNSNDRTANALVLGADVPRLERPGGHIGLMAGSRAKTEIWPDLVDWLAERPAADRREEPWARPRLEPNPEFGARA
jgi:hypothetical protein